MRKKKKLDFRVVLISTALVLGLAFAGSLLLREPPGAFGGGFAPVGQQQMGRYQISGRDANSAWVIDTAVGDVFLMYTNGKWKDVGSLFDEKNRIKN